MTFIDVAPDYEVLRLIWWALLGILLIGFALLGGVDLGVGTLLPIAKNDTEKRMIINSVGPTWEGNQVWFILGGGAAFAAWPYLYSVAFSGFYYAMLLVLLAFILRPVGFDYRHKINNDKWRSMWDIALFIGGFVPSFVFGVAWGNLMTGSPFYFDDFLRSYYTGTFFQLFTPFTLACGLLSLLMLITHGASFLTNKLEGEIVERIRKIALKTSLLFTLFAIICALMVYNMEGYILASDSLHDGPSNPLKKSVSKEIGAWFANYHNYPLLILVPSLFYLSNLLTFFSLLYKKYCMAFLASCTSVITMVANAGLVIFPFIMPSSTVPANSLTIWDASSSHFTLFLMLLATIVFMPIILSYTAWAYRVMRGKISAEYIENNSKHLY